MAETERDNGESRIVRCGDPEEIRNNGLGIHDYADDNGFFMILLLGELMPTYTCR